MDRKSKQKVSFFSLVIIAIFCLILLLSGKLAYEQHTYKQQNQEIATIYPETGQGLQETLHYYQTIAIRNDILFVSVTVLVVILLCIALYSIERYNRNAQVKAQNEELLLLYDLLHSIRTASEPDLSGMQQFENDNMEELFHQLKELSYDIASMRDRLHEDENRTKALITDISHQLKTPLSSIRMSHELTLTDDLSEEERLAFLDTETKEIMKMEALLDELVKLSRLENSMIQIHPVTSSLKNTISEAVSIVFWKANAKHIAISFDMDEDIMLIHDKKWTSEALSNIIENAVKYSEPNSSIQIRVTSLINNVLIEIEDEGIGIPAGEEHMIFKRFYRGSNATKLAKDGAGVGLYLARSIIEQQGGTIVVKRKPTTGSLFKITLPTK